MNSGLAPKGVGTPIREALFEAADPDCEGDEDEVGDCTDCPVGAIGRISTDSTALPPPPPPGV